MLRAQVNLHVVDIIHKQNDNFTMAVESEGAGQATQNDSRNDSLVCRLCFFLFLSCGPSPFKRLEFKNHKEPSQVRVQENNATFEILKKELHNGINIA